MAWSPDDLQMISDGWSLSSLIRALVELTVALCIFLCAILSSATTRLLKGSKSCPSCTLCELNHQRRRTRRDAHRFHPVHDRLETRNCLPSNACNEINLDNFATSTMCENFTLSVSDCSCQSEPVSISNKTSMVRNHCIDSKVRRQDGYCDLDLRTECSACPPHRRWSSEMVKSGSAESNSIEFQNMTVSDGCNSRRLTKPAYRYARSRDNNLKRKFAKVSPNEAKGVFRDTMQGRVINRDVLEEELSKKSEAGVFRNEEKSSAGFREESVGAMDDKRGTNCLREFIPDEFLDCSMQERFSHSTQSPQTSSRRANDSANKQENRSVVRCIPVGRTSPELNGTFPCPWDELKKKKSGMQDTDSERIVKELREMLQVEQEALVALYTELEEERNASSSAAHEAMAMITRLQEEKASIQMEARQYQRMAEEKQLYDQEAMAVLQEILCRRDEELFFLEEELNLSRKRLTSLGHVIEESEADSEVSPRWANDVLLIDRETVSPDGREEWKNLADSRDEKILAEIKDCLDAAKENCVSILDQNLHVPGIKRRSYNEISGLSLSEGRKNLLESFSSASAEDSHSNGVIIEDAQPNSHGVVIEDAQPTCNTAADFEVFQGMMESMRQELSLQGDESLETLKEIEEKFHTERSKETPRNGDELRQIWKNTLRRFEKNEGGIAELRSRLKSTAQRPLLTEATALSCNEDLIDDADTNRAIEEKRLSVLEYVWKFEEQLHQLSKEKRGRPGPWADFQFGKAGSSTGESSKEDSSGAKRVAGEAHLVRLNSFNPSNSSACVEKRILTKPQHRRTAEASNAKSSENDDPFSVKDAATMSGADSASTREEVFVIEASRFKQDRIHGRNLIPLDDHEGQPNSDHSSSDVIVRGESNIDVVHDLNSGASSGMEVVNGVTKESQRAGRCVQHDKVEFFDRIGKPDFTPDDALVDHSGKVRTFENTSGVPEVSIANHGICEQVVKRTGEGFVPAFTFENFSSLPSLHSDILGMKIEDYFLNLVNKLKSLETDRQAMENTISCLRKENGEIMSFQAIAHRPVGFGRIGSGLGRTGSGAARTGESFLVENPANGSSNKEMVPINGFWFSLQTQFSKVAQLFLDRSEPEDGSGDEYAGLCHLAQRLSLSSHPKLQPAKAFKAIYRCTGELPATTTHSTQQSWPLTAKERSGTALSGWDF